MCVLGKPAGINCTMERSKETVVALGLENPLAGCRERESGGDIREVGQQTRREWQKIERNDTVIGIAETERSEVEREVYGGTDLLNGFIS